MTAMNLEPAWAMYVEFKTNLNYIVRPRLKKNMAHRVPGFVTPSLYTVHLKLQTPQNSKCMLGSQAPES